MGAWELGVGGWGGGVGAAWARTLMGCHCKQGEKAGDGEPTRELLQIKLCIYVYFMATLFFLSLFSISIFFWP